MLPAEKLALHLAAPAFVMVDLGVASKWSRRVYKEYPDPPCEITHHNVTLSHPNGPPTDSVPKLCAKVDTEPHVGC